MNKHVIENAELAHDALDGLQASPKRLNSKWFYDPAGSALFEEITELEEYYPTRTELAIMQANTEALTAVVPEGSALIELGSGASVKTQVLLNALTGLGAYVPLDISARFLRQTAAGLRKQYPGLAIRPVATDFMQDFSFPDDVSELDKIAYFPGSTLGNLEQPQAVELLKQVAKWPGVTGFILGVDLVKDTQTLIRAYDDSKGVTAAFNMNILRRLNREVGADFDLNTFTHEARWNPSENRIEMHLVSEIAQTVLVGGVEISFDQGESIHTENSHKYTPETIRSISAQAGWEVAQILTDPKDYFAICILRPASN